MILQSKVIKIKLTIQQTIDILQIDGINSKRIVENNLREVIDRLEELFYSLKNESRSDSIAIEG